MLRDAILLTSGTILRPKQTPGKDIISVYVADDYAFKLVINANRDISDDISFATQGDCATISCKIGHKSSAFGTKTPIHIARYDGKGIYVSFWISFLGADDDMMRIEYSIHMEV